MNATTRTKRCATSTTTAVTESEFHQVRVQEHLRSNALATLGATEDQVAPSYFATSLQEMCAQRLADSFAENYEVDALREEQPELYAMVLERLPTDPVTMLPLRISVPRIIDERYWQRCCEARWPLGQLSRMVGSEKLLGKEYGWKRLFLEHVLCDYLMSLGSTSADKEGGLLPATALAGREVTPYVVPAGTSAAAVTCTPHDVDASRFDLSLDDAAVAALRELCAICRDYVHTIDLPCQLVHFRLYEHLFAHVPGIRSFRLTYGVSKRGVRVGVTDMIGFRDDDATEMRQLLQHSTALDSLRLPLNRLQDRHVQMIVAGLANSTMLRVLDLSQNALTDVAVVDAVAVLLTRPDFPLEELYLQDNNLGDGAAAALAEALHLNKTLRILNVQQNCIGDAEGGALLVRALSVQPTLVNVKLSNNRLGKSTLNALAEILPQLSHLSVLHVAGNALLAGSKIPSTASIAPVHAEGSSAGAAAAMPVPVLPLGTANSTSTAAPLRTPSESARDHDTSLASVTMMACSDTPKGTGPECQSATMITPETAQTAEEAAGKGETGGATLVATVDAVNAAPAAMEQTEGGVVLCSAVMANKSLVELDVRFCGFTPEEEKAMMAGVHERVFRRKMETMVAAKESEQRRELKQRTEAKVSRMTGRAV